MYRPHRVDHSLCRSAAACCLAEPHCMASATKSFKWRCLWWTKSCICSVPWSWTYSIDAACVVKPLSNLGCVVKPAWSNPACCNTASSAWNLVAQVFSQIPHAAVSKWQRSMVSGIQQRGPKLATLHLQTMRLAAHQQQDWKDWECIRT